MSWPQGAGKCQPTPQTLALMDEKNAEARNAVIEECAKIADGFAKHEGDVFDAAGSDGALSVTGRHSMQDRAIARQTAAEGIARKIRALSVSRPEGNTP